MEDYNKLLLHAAFACMACDGDIDPREVELIRKAGEEQHLFGDLDLATELHALVESINAKGKRFIHEFLEQLKTVNLSQEQELNLLRVAVKMIHADEVVLYSEIKFFKVLKSCLKSVTDSQILSEIEGTDDNFIAPDIQDDYSALLESYFSTTDLPQFEHITSLLKK